MKIETPVVKNKQYDLEITALGNEGQGIGRINQFTVFVEGALPEERVTVLIIKVKKSYAVGKLLEVKEISPMRVTPKCPVAKNCGGCQLTHLSYPGQLAFKQNKVQEHLKRIGRFENIAVLPVIGMDSPFHYRNKAQYPVGNQNGKLAIGFYAKRSHRIVDTENCLLQHRCNVSIIKIVREFMDEFQIQPYQEETHTGLVRHILTRVGFYTGEIMVCLVLTKEDLPNQQILIERLKQLDGMTSIVININNKRTNVILGSKNKVLWGQEFITDTIGDIRFAISPLSFYQVNPAQTKVIYDKALALADLKGTETVLDLYCGIGTISLYLAKHAKQVLGVEVVSQAVQDAKRNALLNGIDNVSFLEGAAEEVIPRLYQQEGIQADVVVVDPPRKGCDQRLLDTIIAMKPSKLIYISCDSATLARDLCILNENGFIVQIVQPIDQFPLGVHVETVVLLSHKNP